MKLPNDLRRAAIAEFKAGGDWQRFVAEHGHVIAEAAPFDRTRYQALRGKLLHLVVTGDPSGQYGPGDPDAADPWLADDDTPVADTLTRAKFNPAAAGIEPLVQSTFVDTSEAYR